MKINPLFISLATLTLLASGCDDFNRNDRLRTYQPPADAGTLLPYFTFGAVDAGGASWQWGSSPVALVINSSASPDGSVISVEILGPAAIELSDAGVVNTQAYSAFGSDTPLVVPLRVSNQLGDVIANVRAGARTWSQSFHVTPLPVDLHTCVPQGDGGCAVGEPDAGGSAPSPPCRPSSTERNVMECLLNEASQSRPLRRGVLLDVGPLLTWRTGAVPITVETVGNWTLTANQPVASVTSPFEGHQQITRFMDVTGDGIGTFRVNVANGPWQSLMVPLGRGSVVLRRAELVALQGAEIQTTLTFCGPAGASIALATSNGTASSDVASTSATLVEFGPSSLCPTPSTSAYTGRWRGAPAQVVWTTTENTHTAVHAVDLGAWRVDSLALRAISRAAFPRGTQLVMELSGSNANTTALPFRNAAVQVDRFDPRYLTVGADGVVEALPQDGALPSTAVTTNDDGRFVVMVQPLQLSDDASVDASIPSMDADTDGGVAGTPRFVVALRARPELSAAFNE